LSHSCWGPGIAIFIISAIMASCDAAPLAVAGAPSLLWESARAAPASTITTQHDIRTIQETRDGLVIFDLQGLMGLRFISRKGRSAANDTRREREAASYIMFSTQCRAAWWRGSAPV